ncbi:MAG: hypothetical protein ABI672_09340 [Vicinamibacteria bacterium]
MRYRRLVVAIVSIALALPAPLNAQSGPQNSDLALGIRQVDVGNVAAAVVTLDGAIRQLTGAKGREEELSLAHLYMGIAYIELSQFERAMAEMREAWANNKGLSLDPKKFAPRVIQAFDEAKAEARGGPTNAKVAPSPHVQPAEKAQGKKGGGGSKALLIGGGLAAAGAGVFLALKKDPLDVDDDKDGTSENQGDCNDRNAAVGPQGTFQFSNARFETASFNCPRGTNLPDPKIVLFDGLNNTCSTAAVLSVSATVTITTVSGTNNFVGQAFTFANVAFTPNSVAAAGSPATFRATIGLVCSNPSGGGGTFNDVSGRITISSSVGQVTLTTTNTARTVFP